MSDRKQMTAFIAVQCKTLRIKPPRIIWSDPASFRTETTLAALAPNGKSMMIRNNITDARMLLFSVTHELRHAWQMVYAPELLTGFSASDEISLDAYNAQPAEIDANAWALIVMIELFGVRPTLEETLGMETWTKIERRAKEIAAEIGGN